MKKIHYQEKYEKEAVWFVRKYIQTDKIEFFIKHLSPYDLTKIIKLCLKEGMEFNWTEKEVE